MIQLHEYVYWANFKEKRMRFASLELAMKQAHHDFTHGGNPMYVWENQKIRHDLRGMFDFWRKKGWKF